MRGTIMVIGSMNMDFVVHVPRLPRSGETILGSSLEMIPGGKGANQAYAVARLGGAARFIGCVGQDAFGRQLISNLRSAGVDTSAVTETSKSFTGLAFIAVEESGQNQIMVAPGANEFLVSEQIRESLNIIRPDFLLLQLEIPMSAVECAISLGHSQGSVIILDPAPAKPVRAEQLSQIDICTPNESEAFCLLGTSGNTVPLGKAAEIAAEILKMGPKEVILKLGENGAWYANKTRSLHFPGKAVQAVDVTAAGDTFNAALAVSLAEGKSIDEAIHFANAAAALSVTRVGAQASIPSRDEVNLAL